MSGQQVLWIAVAAIGRMVHAIRRNILPRNTFAHPARARLHFTHKCASALRHSTAFAAMNGFSFFVVKAFQSNNFSSCGSSMKRNFFSSPNCSSLMAHSGTWNPGFAKFCDCVRAEDGENKGYHAGEHARTKVITIGIRQ